MTDRIEEAESALATYLESVEQGHPWIPGALFASNPGLERRITAAFKDFVHDCKVEELTKPARRVSLSDNPRWRPSSVVPEVYYGKDDDQRAT